MWPFKSKEQRELEAVQKIISTNAKESSFNYDFTYKGLKNMCINKLIKVNEFFKNDENVKKLIQLAYSYASSQNKGIGEPIFLNTKFYYGIANNGDKAIVFEILARPERECDCNFIALLSDESGKQYVYTSEYYKMTNEFGLYAWYEDGLRMDYSNDDIKTLDLFLEATGIKLVNND